MSKITTPAPFYEFFTAWKRVCAARKNVLLDLWDNSHAYTHEVIKRPGAVLDELAEHFGLEVYEGYYSIDAIFHRPEDRVHCTPEGQRWVQNIRIAFEHENDFTSGLFQEVSHLLITRAELRVLVAYPRNDTELAYELQNLQRIIMESGFGSLCPSFLFITGQLNGEETDIHWQAYIYDGSSQAFRSLEDQATARQVHRGL